MTTMDYWTTSAEPEQEHRALNWRLVLALSLNLAAWAAILKTF